MALCDSEVGSELILWDFDTADNSSLSRFVTEGHPVSEGNVSWYFESGTIGRDVKKGMRPSRLFLKAELKDGSTLGVGLIYGGKSTPEVITSISDGKNGYFEIPINTVREGVSRIAVYGRGEAQIFGYDVEYVSEKA